MEYSELIAKMKALRLVIYDFDGVMTNNKVHVDENGVESVEVSRADGYGVSQIKKLGIEQGIISTEPNPVVKRRAEKLKIPVVHDVQDKGMIFRNYVQNLGLSMNEVMYIGNDLNDYDAIIQAGLKGAPEDAEQEILAIADWISSRKGGDGVIRELYRLLSEARA